MAGEHPPEVQAKIEAARKEAAARANRVPPGSPNSMAIPDQLGAAMRKTPPPPPKRQAIPMPPGDDDAVIVLSTVDGSDLHLLELNVRLVSKELEKVSLRQEIAKKNLKIAELESQHFTRILGEHKKNLADKMKTLHVPDGWNFSRRVDGSYIVENPQAPPPQGGSR